MAVPLEEGGRPGDRQRLVPQLVACDEKDVSALLHRS
jgi:hypothetical protein